MLPDQLTAAPEHVTFALSAGTFHALALGDPAAPPLVWLHGFPDHPPTAIPFLAHLARKRRVIAPWLRGYAPSPGAGPFDVATLAGDIIELVAHLAPRRLELVDHRTPHQVDIVGHDWGAVITYAICALAPETVHRAVTLAVPHPLTFLRSLRRPAQLRRSWYMLLFQLPGSARLARARDFALIDRLWRTWSPGFALSADDRSALHACLADSFPSPLSYYRARDRRSRDLLRRLARPLTTPFLQLHGADDGCILPQTANDDRRFVARTRDVIRGAGHFLHLERPADIAARVVAFLS